MSKRKSQILRMLSSAGQDPGSHDDWIANWNTLYNEFEELPNSTGSFSELEQTALGALANIDVAGNHTHLNSELCRILDTFKHPALLINEKGVITAQNASATNSYNIEPGDQSDKLGVELRHSESISRAVNTVLNSNFPKDKALFKQGCIDNSSHELTVVITASSGEFGPVALVFLISSRFNAQTAQLIQKQYGVTKAECEVLASFIEGYSLKEIARKRERSHATIRTQFNSLQGKMGAHSQASLIRTTLSLSDFTNELDRFSAVLGHPYRRCANVMRPGGRMVEVRFCGDPNGRPVLYIPTMATAEFISQFENQLYIAGIYLITVFAPAQGRTDPPRNGDPRDQVRIDDIEAVMDMLNVDKFAVIACNAGTAGAFTLAASLPDRVSRIILVSACPPANYWLKYGTSASWVDAALRMGEKYPAAKRLIATAALKGCKAIGAKRFHKLQLAGNEHDIEVQMRPENVQQIENAFEYATSCGMEPLIDDCMAILSDFSETISLTRCPVSIIHGTIDAVFPIKCMREFQQDFNERADIFEVEGAGFTLVSSHPAQVVSLLDNIISTEPCLHNTKHPMKTHSYAGANVFSTDGDEQRTMVQ